jgi:glutaredoxin
VDRNVSFEESDIERTPNALQELVELTGSATHVPVLIVDGEVFIDFGTESLTKIVDLLS